jgi:hypothetical protein
MVCSFCFGAATRVTSAFAFDSLAVPRYDCGQGVPFGLNHGLQPARGIKLAL